jgi:F420-dependent oxidoreductase-like protein
MLRYTLADRYWGDALNKITFGVFLPFYAIKNKTRGTSLFSHFRDIILECERLGYHSAWLDDHLLFGKTPILECWATLSALSSLTKSIRLGTMVTSAAFRNPALLAKMAATVDIISSGRLEFGIGAGMQEKEHNAYGFQFLKSNQRIARMKEAVEIIRKLWTEEKTSYEGEYYRVQEASCLPKPLQKPHPPITIGGSGEQLTLKATAQFADRCDFGYMPSIELYRHKLQVLEKHCKTVGRSFEDIEKSCWPAGQIIIAQTHKDLDIKVQCLKPKSLTREEFEKNSFVGTTDEFTSRIQPYVDLGVTHFMLYFGEPADFSCLRLFAETVLKNLQ